MAKRRWLVPTAGALGAGLLAWLVVDLGPATVAGQLRRLGTILPAVLALTFIKYPLQAAGWRLALPPAARPSWRGSIMATITGDALGYLTWAGPFTGEPMRAMLLRDRVAVASGVAAGAIERATYNSTAAILALGVFAVVSARARRFVLLGLVVTSATALAMVWLTRWRRGTKAAKPAATDDSLALAPRSGARSTARGGRAVLRAIRELWRERRNALPSIAALSVAHHTVLVCEAYLLLGTLDADVTIGTALVFEAATKVVNTVGLLVPGRLGIAEGGSAVLADALGFPATYGLSLALMRRARAVIWAGAGLALLPFQERRARRAD
jgi:uncharacterized protein (TIRG00374 family)